MLGSTYWLLFELHLVLLFNALQSGSQTSAPAQHGISFWYLSFFIAHPLLFFVVFN